MRQIKNLEQSGGSVKRHFAQGMRRLLPQWPPLRKRGLGLSISFRAWHNGTMTDADDRKAKREAERSKRLAAELRANLQRRKAQTRARRAGDEDSRAGLPASGSLAPVKPEGGK